MQTASELDIAGRTVHGIGWIGASQVVRQAFQFVLLIVLARLLSPSAFGLVGMVTVVVGFAAMFAELGLGAALVQHAEISDRHCSSVFWLNLAVGAALSGAFAIGAPVLSAFYGQPALTPITMVAGLTFAISASAVVPSALLTRRMDFRSLALVETTAAVGAGLAAIALALAGFGVWSLVGQSLLLAAMTAAGTWWKSGWKPRLLVDRAAIADVVGFGGNLLGFNALNYWLRTGDDLLIGRFLGAAALGNYSRAYSTMLLPLSQVVAVIGRVMFPALSRIQHDRTQVREVYLRAVAAIAFLTFPMMAGLAVVADDFVLALFGPAWSGMIPPLRIFSLLGAAQSIASTVGWIYQSQGRTDLFFRWGVGSAVVVLASFGVGIWMGTIESMAMCYAIASGLLMYPCLAIPGRLIDMSVFDVVQRIAGVVACAAAMAGAVTMAHLVLPQGWGAWPQLLIQVGVGVAVYGSLVHAVDLDVYRDVKSLILQQLPGRTPMPQNPVEANGRAGISGE